MTGKVARTGARARRYVFKLPFGEEIGAGISGRTAQQGYITDGVRQKFVGKERDVETGLDYSVNRYYSSPHGRFTTPDPIFITLDRMSDPQTINLYAYARNNPLRFTDPDGLYLFLRGLAGGDLADIMSILAELERITGVKLKYDSTTGQVTIAGDVPAKLSANAQEILALIQDPNNHVLLTVIDDPKGATKQEIAVARLIGVAQPNKNEQKYIAETAVDMSDVDKVIKGGITTLGDIIAHETVEAYRAAKKGADIISGKITQKQLYGEIHGAGIAAENNNRGPDRPQRTTSEGFVMVSNKPLKTSSGDYIYRIDFSTHVEYLIIDGTNAGVVKDVQVIKKQ